MFRLVNSKGRQEQQEVGGGGGGDKERLSLNMLQNEMYQTELAVNYFQTRKRNFHPVEAGTCPQSFVRRSWNTPCDHVHTAPTAIF